MSITSIISIVINVLFALFILFGFLWGIKRGLKKSSLRLGTLIVFVAVGAVCSPYITKALLGIKLPFLSDMGLLDYVKQQILSNPEVSEIMTANPSLLTLMEQLIVVVINLVVFIVLMLVFKMISWIIFAIIARFVFKKERLADKEYKARKKGKTPKGEVLPMVQDNPKLPPRPAENTVLAKPYKKYRWWGGLIGAVQGLVLVFVFFFPITGLVGTFSDLRAEATTTAGESSGEAMLNIGDKSFSFENNSLVVGSNQQAISGGGSSSNLDDLFTPGNMPETLGEVINQVVPSEVLEILDTFERSAIARVNGAGGFDRLCFDSIASTRVNGERIAFRTEVKNFQKIYKDVAYLFNLEWSVENAKNIDFSRVRNAVNNVFNIGIARAILPEIIPWAAEKYVIDSGETINVDYDADIKGTVDSVINNLTANDQFMDNLKSDVLALVDTAEPIVKSGVLEILMEEGETNIVEVLDKLLDNTDNKECVLSKSLSALFTSKSLQITITSALNIGYKELNKQFELTGDNAIGQLVYSKSLWDTTINQYKSIVNNIASAYQFALHELTDSQKDALTKIFKDSNELTYEDVEEVLNSNYKEKLIMPIGKTYDVFKELAIFKPNNKSAFNSIIDKYASEEDTSIDAEIKKFIDFEAIKTISLEAELAKICDVVEIINQSKILQEIIGAESLNYENIIEKLTDKPEGSDDTYLVSIINKTLNTSMINKVVEGSVDIINENLIKLLGDETEEDKFLLNITKSSDIADAMIKLIEDLVGIVNADNVDAVMEFAEGADKGSNKVIDLILSLNVADAENKTPLEKIGNALDTFFNTSVGEEDDKVDLFKPLYRKLMTYVKNNYNDEIKDYMDIDVVINAYDTPSENGFMETEFAMISNIFSNLETMGDTNDVGNQGMIDEIKALVSSDATEETRKANINSIIDILATTEAGKTETNLQLLLKDFVADPLLNNLFIYFFDEVNKSTVEDFGEIFDLDKVNAENKEAFIGGLSDAVVILKEDIKDIVSNGFGGDMADRFIDILSVKDADYISNFDKAFGDFFDNDLVKPLFVNGLNKIYHEINRSMNLTGEDEISDIDLTTNISSQKADIIAFVDNALPLADNILGSTFDLNTLDFAKVGALLDVMKNNAYEANSFTANAGSVFAGPYEAILNYLKAEPTFGAKITELVNKYYDQSQIENIKYPADINWVNMLEVASVAKDLVASGDTVGVEDLSKVLEVIQDDPALQDEIKEVIKDVVPAELGPVIDELDLGDEDVITAVDALADMAEVLSEPTATSEEVQQAAEDMVETILGITETTEGAKTVEDLIDIVSEVATVGSVELPAETDTTEIIADINNSGLTADAKAQLKALLGIEEA